MHDHPKTDSVVVDCDRCLVRSPGACGDCIVTVLLGSPPAGIEIDAQEMAALEVLADAGCVPPLRLVTPVLKREVTPALQQVTPVTGPDIQTG
jgi:hypothetical protein